MKTKKIYARVCPKRDTTANWEMHPEFIPLKGEFIIYTDKTVYTDEQGKRIVIPGVKVGDGLSYIGDLPFIGDDAQYIHATDYNQLRNKPRIGGKELEGDMDLEELGIQKAGDYPEVPLSADDIDAIIDAADEEDT